MSRIRELPPRLIVFVEIPERDPIVVVGFVEAVISKVPVPLIVIVPVDINAPEFARLKVPADMVVPPE